MKDIETIYTRKLYEAEMMLQMANQYPQGSALRNYWLYGAEKATDQAERAKWVIHLLCGRVAPISYN